MVDVLRPPDGDGYAMTASGEALPPGEGLWVALRTHIESLMAEHWRSHEAIHSRDREVLDQSAGAVLSVLDKAAAHMDQRMGALLDTHLDLHRSDAAALILARDDIARQLAGMVELRAALQGERGKYITRDVVDEKIGTLDDKRETMIAVLRAEFKAQGEAIRGEARGVVDKVQSEQQAQNKRLMDLENKQSNLDGRFAILGAGLVFGLAFVQLAIHFLSK